MKDKGKKNKKDKKNKKGIIQDTKLNNVNTEKSNIEEMKESRRSTRMGTIIAIVAVLGTICTVLYKITRNAINIWPESGYIYYIYMWILFLSALGGVVLIFGEIIWYIIGDIKRYNILDENYVCFDEISDKRYFSLISDFDLLVKELCFVLLLAIPVFIFLYDGILKYVYIGISILLGVVGIVVSVSAVRKKKISRSKAWDVVKRISLWLFTCFCVFVFVIFTLLDNNAVIYVYCEKNGKINISNKLKETFVSFAIYIYDEMGDTLIEQKEIEKDELLFAKEIKMLSAKSDGGTEIGTAQELAGETLYWNYQYNLSDVKLEEGRYLLVIYVQQDNKSVKIMNEVEVCNGEYSYGKEKIQKEY